MADMQGAGTTEASAAARSGEQYWRERVAAWRSSGLTQSEFCRRGDVNWNGFRYWRVKLDGESGIGDRAVKLVAVKGGRGMGSGGEIRIRLRDRYVVEVSEGFDAGALWEVLDLLERR